MDPAQKGGTSVSKDYKLERVKARTQVVATCLGVVNTQNSVYTGNLKVKTNG